MRQVITGLVAAVAVMATTPAMACGYGACAHPHIYVAPVAPVGYGYSACNPCVGWARELLPDPQQQYYYVNQGPTYTGPGNFAPPPVYREGSISGYGHGYNRPHRHRAHRYHHGQPVLSRYY